MAQPTAYVLLIDGYADWEAASALAELRRTFGFAVRTVGISRDHVLSMGGLRVAPDMALAQFRPASAEILILPGGDARMAGELPGLSALLAEMAASGRPIAAICAATLACAHAGLLDDRAHTSNGRGFIEKYVPQYRGQRLYRPHKAVAGGGVITANGLAPFAFAAEIFRTLAPDRADDNRNV